MNEIAGYDTEIGRDPALRAWQLYKDGPEGWQIEYLKDFTLRHMNAQMGEIWANPAALVPVALSRLPEETRELHCLICQRTNSLLCHEDVVSEWVCRECADREDSCSIGSYSHRVLYGESR